jgi:hypothetical protein
MDEDAPGSQAPTRRPAATALTAHDRRRLAVAWRSLATGIGLGVVGAAGSGLAGASGTVGFALLVLGAAFGAVLAALVGGVLAVVDEVRGAPVARRRLHVTIALFLAGLLLLTVGAAVGG